MRHFRTEGRLRSKPLNPTNKPFEALDALAKSPRWVFNDKEGLNDDERGRHLLGDQILRLANTVYRVEPNIHGGFLPWGMDKADVDERNKIISGLSERPIRWEPAQMQFVFLDGKSLPEPEVKRYRRVLWQPKIDGLDVTLTLERHSKRFVGASLSGTYEVGKARPDAVVHLIAVGTPRKPLAELRPGAAPELEAGAAAVDARIGARGWYSTGTVVELLEGSEIQAELTKDGKVHKSPVYRP